MLCTCIYHSYRHLDGANETGLFRKTVVAEPLYILQSLVYCVYALFPGRVAAFAEGGALDYIKDGENGILFDKQNVAALVEAIEKLEKTTFDPRKIFASANKFSVARFNKEITEFINEKTR